MTLNHTLNPKGICGKNQCRIKKIVFKLYVVGSENKGSVLDAAVLQSKVTNTDEISFKTSSIVMLMSVNKAIWQSTEN